MSVASSPGSTNFTLGRCPRPANLKYRLLWIAGLPSRFVGLTRVGTEAFKRFSTAFCSFQPHGDAGSASTEIGLCPSPPTQKLTCPVRSRSICHEQRLAVVCQPSRAGVLCRYSHAKACYEQFLSRPKPPEAGANCPSGVWGDRRRHGGRRPVV